MNISSKQVIILDFIKKFCAEYGYSPTVREICKGLEYKSPSTVHEHLKKLERLGIIKTDKSKSRTIELLVDNEYKSSPNDCYKIPVISEKFGLELPTEYVVTPIFLLNDYNPDDIFIYKDRSEIYYLNSKAASTKDSEVLTVIDGRYKIQKSINGEKILGVVISKCTLYK